MNQRIKSIPVNTIILIATQFVGVMAWTFTMKADIGRNADSVYRIEREIEVMSKEGDRNNERLILMKDDITKILTILSFALDIPEDVLERTNINTTSYIQ